MKKLTRLALTLLAVITCFSSFTACGKTKAPNTATDIQIYLWESGYGTEFMKEIVAGFNAKQDVYKATLETEQDASVIINTLSLGTSNTYDLYFTMLNTNQYNKDFIALDSVLDYTAEGESKSIREKYYDYALNGVKNADGTTNFLTYGNGWCGIVYNKDVIDGGNYTLPRTSKELADLTATIANDITDKKFPGVKAPWLFYNDKYNNGYLDYLTFVWEAQYDGLDYYYNTLLALKDEKGVTPSKEVFLREDGRLKALTALEGVIAPETVHDAHTDTIFTNVQTLYLNGEAVFMVNGSWLMNESTGSKTNFGMMKTPVISSIVEKLEDTSMSDRTLSAIVKEIDDGATSSDKCSQADFDRIKSARNLLYNNTSEQYVFIPEYSNAKEGSIEFLKYFYSDEGLLKFMNATGLANSAKLDDESKFDVNKLDDWHKIQVNFANNLTALTDAKNKSSVFLNSSINQFAGVTYGQDLCNQNKNDRKSAEQLWKAIQTTINNSWKDWSGV